MQGHLPFERTFGPEYQEYLTKDDLAKGYSAWAKKFDIVSSTHQRGGLLELTNYQNVWQGTEVLCGTWDSSQKLWTLKLKRGEEEHSITSSFVVLAGGAGGQVPVFPPPYEDRVSAIPILT